jgi:RNA recognition motif-containing protein
MGKRLYVGNLPYSVSEQDLTDKFGAFGTVESVNVITDRDSGRSKGFGFVEMATDDEAQKAIEEINGTDYDGRPVTVNEAKPMKKRDDNRW